MQPSESNSPQRTAAKESASAAWVVIALPAIVVLAVFLGGATQRWSEAIVLGAFALLLLFHPPHLSLGRGLNLLALLFIALAAVGFLPAHWFSTPHWRIALTKDLGIELPNTVSPQPWLTFDNSFLLLAGVCWIYYVASLEMHLREVRMATRLFAGGIIALAGLCLFLYFRHEAPPFWHNARGFGPFPNRNQTGDLFGISTLVVLGCLQDDFRRGRKRWLLWLIGLGILIASLILAFSRAGILILVIGFAAWLVRFVFRKASGAGVATAASVLLLLFISLLLFGGETIERFHLRLGSEGPVTSDFRWLIFSDALDMIRASPWCGVGLGNFESVFALFRNAARGIGRSLHPESDWLWVWAEMGWPALLLLLIAGALFVRRAFPLREGTNQRLRYTALVGGLLFILHGFVDVSAHRLASFLVGTFLFGIAQFRPLPLRSSRFAPILFRMVGVILLLVSLAWFFAWRDALALPGLIGVENARATATIASRGYRFPEAIAATDRGLQLAPLDWQLYFLRAGARLGKREPLADVVADFRRARFLEPSAYQLPFEEGKVWLGWQPALAITAWREALQRQGAKEAGIYALMLAESEQRDGKTHEALRDLAVDRPDLTVKYLEAATPAEFETMIKLVLASDPSLGRFSVPEKQRLFELWSTHDPLDELLRQVQLHPDWLELGWPGVARYHVGQNDFAEAWKLVRRYAQPPAMPQAAEGASLAGLAQQLYARPNDFALGYSLYRAEMKAGKVDDALNTARHFDAQPGAPPYFYYLEAEAWGAKENWPRAWELWQRYQTASRQQNKS
ncbi:MAG TPA: O-antigen ligase family protein [Chthoniobacterales bacterium]|jgi:O-antigen ligase